MSVKALAELTGKLKRKKDEPDLAWYSFSPSAPKEDRFEEGLVRIEIGRYSSLGSVDELKRLPPETAKRIGLRFSDKDTASILLPRNIANSISPRFENELKELFNTRRPKDCNKNYHALLEELAQKELEEKLEDNLKWDVENHFTQGKHFSEKLLENNNLGLTKKLEPSQEILSFYGSFTSGQYHKYWALTCQKGKRHVMTLITKKEFSIEELNKALSEKNDFDQKLSELTQKTEAEYLHLSEFFGNKKFNDKTFMR